LLLLINWDLDASPALPLPDGDEAAAALKNCDLSMVSSREEEDDIEDDGAAGATGGSRPEAAAAADAAGGGFWRDVVDIMAEEAEPPCGS
jgi:hypothetical protein